jgi:two-component system CheB/CheR fusion protein
MSSSLHTEINQEQQEIARLKAQLREAEERHAIIIEESQISNEELRAINEEYQTITDELTVSQEQLRVINEQLNQKVEEISRINDDLENLISSTDTAIIFLDSSMRIRRFTPRSRDIFNLIPADEGRSLSDITHRLEFSDIIKDAKDVYAISGRIERELMSRDGIIYLLRILPYRTKQDVIEGVVLTFVDITERKRAEDELHRSHCELEERVRERTRELDAAINSLNQEVHERSTAEARVRGLLKQIVTVQEEERRRLARELHDTLGQQFAALRLGLAMIKEKAVGQVALRDLIDRMQPIFTRVDSDIDFLAWELRPAALDQLGLEAALRDFIRDWSRHFGIAADYQSFGLDEVRLPSEIETNLYRILQEALQNVYKHAGADHVAVLLQRQSGQAILTVEDNGEGYDADEEVAVDSNRGMGITNMRERAALISGSFSIESTPGEGTTILIRVPVGTTNEGIT